jgi:hypothetical protein
MACSRLLPQMLKPLQRFRKLDREARSLCLRGSMLLLVVAVSIRVCGLRGTQTMLGYFLPGASDRLRPPDERAAQDVARTAFVVGVAARYGIVRPTCLEKSLALWWLLGRRGLASSVRIGTRKNAGRLEAHAWVEFDGRALNEVEQPRTQYAAFDGAFPLWSQK